MYEPFEHPNQLRCLHLESGDFDDPIHAYLEIISLTKPCKYEALSYVWGIPKAISPMIVDGTELSITENLDTALRHLRPKPGSGQSSRTLWVDAVCINQSDNKERADQVKLMRDIYRSAFNVLIWLGPAADGSDVVLRSIQRNDSEECWKSYNIQRGFVEILYRPWFTRIWVVQEFVLGRSPRIGCGTTWISWVTFIHAWSTFPMKGGGAIDDLFKKELLEAIDLTFQSSWTRQDHFSEAAVEGKPATTAHELVSGLKDLLGDVGNSLPNLRCLSWQKLLHGIEANPVLWAQRQSLMNYHRYESPTAKVFWRRWGLVNVVPITYNGFLYHARATLLNRKSLSIVSILKGTMNLRSTDPRDRIYGFLGLVSEDARRNIPVDYDQGSEWTFLLTMEHIIKHEPGGLAVLGLLWQTRPFKFPVPSWVADFTVSADWKDPHSPVFLRGSCANAPWDWVQDANVSNDRTTLSASGLSFGKVKELVQFVDGDSQAYIPQFRAIEALIAEHCPSNEPLWRTLIGIHNTGEAASNPDSQLGQRFKTLMESVDDQEQVTESIALAQKLFSDSILPTVQGRLFFITDRGFAGISTPMIRKNDTIGLIFGMERVAVLRSVQPTDLELKMEATTDIDARRFHRITAFAYVGCHDRQGFFKQQQKGGYENWKDHLCFREACVTNFNVL